MRLALAILFASIVGVSAAQPRLKPLKVSWSPYVVPQGASNVVIVLYKSTSLGLAWTPFKPAAYFPATRTNGAFAVIAPGKYRFYCTAQGAPYPESVPSNTVEKTVE